MILAMLVENSDSFKTMWTSKRFGKCLTISSKLRTLSFIYFLMVLSPTKMSGLWDVIEFG